MIFSLLFLTATVGWLFPIRISNVTAVHVTPVCFSFNFPESKLKHNVRVLKNVLYKM